MHVVLVEALLPVASVVFAASKLHAMFELQPAITGLAAQDICSQKAAISGCCMRARVVSWVLKFT